MAYDNGYGFHHLGHTPGQVDYVNVIDRKGNVVDYEVPLWEAHFKYKRHHSPAIAVMMDTWDGGDSWGSATEMAFAICEVARVMGEAEPQEILRYLPGALDFISQTTLDDLASGDSGNDISISTELLATAVLDGRVDSGDLTFAARVLNRYRTMLDNAGLSY